jgi:hypothetical protein
VGQLAGRGWIKSNEMFYKFISLLMVFLVGIYFIIQGIRY